MTSLHYVGFLAHAMNRENLLVFAELSRRQQRLLYRHKVNLNKILNERNLGVSKLKQF